MESTMVLIKPDAVQRGLVGEIIKRMEQRGLKLTALKLVQVTTEFAEKHYAEHVGKSFFNGLIRYITSAPVVAMVWEGPRAVAIIRQMTGKTDPLEADPGSIRHDFALTVSRNLVHASDSPESAQKEIELWFKKEEVIGWDRDNDPWILQNN